MLHTVKKNSDGSTILVNRGGVYIVSVRGRLAAWERKGVAPDLASGLKLFGQYA